MSSLLIGFGAVFPTAGAPTAQPLGGPHSTVQSHGVVLAGGFEWGSTGRH